jgi:Na+/H+ antiporter NhaA
MVNTNYHKSINKTLISRNYFDALQKRLLLCNSYHEHPKFAIGILKDFGKDVANAWNIWLVINKVTHSIAAVIRIRALQSEHGTSLRIVIGTTIIRQLLMLADLYVRHREVLRITQSS